MWDSIFQKQLFSQTFILILLLASATSAHADNAAIPYPDTWDLDPANHASLAVAPIRETAISRDGLRLALKHLPRPGAQPLLLIHGLAQNDRAWDSTIQRYSFARFMHAQGYDVWMGNFRGAGTAGFRSETPAGPHHWTVDDYAINDLPSMVERVNQLTGLKPFVIAHSLGAWALDGYLAGLSYDNQGHVMPHAEISAERQNEIRGVVSLAGVYNLRWQHSLAHAVTDPIRNQVDYYHSDYELELLAAARPIYRVIAHLPGLPMGWIGNALNLPLAKIPFVGGALEKLYQGFQSDVVGSPVLNMFYYAPASDRAVVRLHAQDGLEDLGPRVIEQLANAINDRRTSSYYHMNRPTDAYDYGAIQSLADLPTLIIGGGRDRLASDFEIYNDGFLKSQAHDKQYLHVEEFGHMDIISGIHAPSEVMTPIVSWLRQH